MVQISRKALYENAIDPVIQGPVYQKIFFTANELVKIVAAKVFLELFGKKYLTDLSVETSQDDIYDSTIFAPLLEEFLFRGCTQRGIQGLQRVWTLLWGNNLTDEDLKAQQVVRVHFSALLFGAVHLGNDHVSVIGALFQFTHCYLSGVSYGYITEKYQTLSVTILLHGVHNSLAIASKVYPFCNVLMPMLDIAACALAVLPRMTIVEIKNIFKASRKNIVENYIHPVIQHPIYQINAEAVKLIGASVFLQFMGKRIWSDPSSGISEEEAYQEIVLLPALEALSFRGILQQGIYLSQKGWNYLRGQHLTDEQWKTQQAFRVHLTAFLYAAASLWIPDPSSASTLIRFSWVYFNGLTFGYISEKYRTLSVEILSCGVLNVFMYQIKDNRLAMTVEAVQVVSLYILAVTKIDEKVFSGLGQAVQFCVDLPARLMNGRSSETVLDPIV